MLPQNRLTAMMTISVPRSSHSQLTARTLAASAVTYSPRTYSTMAWIWASVSMLPKPGMRPVPCACGA